MKHLPLLTAGALSLCLSLPVAAAGTDEHAGHHPEKPAAAAAPPADTRMDELRARMRAMREERDPQKRMAMMEMQKKDMAAMREHAQSSGMMGGQDCMMMGRDAKRETKGNRDMGGMKMGGGMHGTMERHMEMMDMRMEMMQMMIEQMGMPKAADSAATK